MAALRVGVSMLPATRAVWTEVRIAGTAADSLLAPIALTMGRCGEILVRMGIMPLGGIA
jgi:hypothetical protein